MNGPNETEQMKHATASDPFDRILATEEPILPSSGFLASVVDRVEEESRVPARIPFPWKRAIPGVILAAGIFGWGGYEFISTGIPLLQNPAFPQLHLPPAATQSLDQAAWVALALVVSLLSWRLSRRLSGQS